MCQVVINEHNDCTLQDRFRYAFLSQSSSTFSDMFIRMALSGKQLTLTDFSRFHWMPSNISVVVNDHDPPCYARFWQYLSADHSNSLHNQLPSQYHSFKASYSHDNVPFLV